MVEAETLKILTKNYTDLKTLLWILIGVIVVHILAMLFRYFLDYKLKERDKNIHKKNLLVNRTIQIQELLFNYLDELTLFEFDQSVLMLQKISEIERFVDKNKLYIDKEVLQVTEKCLDYFKSLLSTFSNKDVKKEMLFLEEYVKKFNK